MMRIIITIIAIAMGSIALPASAVTVQVVGTVTHVDTPLIGEFSVGESMNFTFTYDPNIEDQFPTDERIAWYFGAINYLSFTIGDYAVGMTGLGNIQIQNGPGGNYNADSFSTEVMESLPLTTRPSATLIAEPVSGLDPYYAGFNIVDHDMSIFSMDSLITSFPDLSLIESTELFLGFAQSVGSNVAYGVSRVEGQITGITVVPVPSTIALFSSGIMVLVALKKRSGS